ncbi:MAG: cytochrome c oxidase assembly protein [Alphaproteobacteria bacterium]|nr:cytochrome c oxidase assembly protein [Alphaproteobacteria bacterium]
MTSNNSKPDNNTYDEVLIAKNRRAGLIVLGVVIAMIGLSFVSVPLYNMFCRVTGLAGTTQEAEILPETILEREVTIRFDSNTARNLPWDFKPEKKSIKLKVGARGFINFIAKNNGDEPITGMAVYNVTPLKAGKYFTKIQCFCFDSQVLQPGQKVNMPVLFFVDPKIDENELMDDVTTITLSYSFFHSESEGLDKAMEEIYESK